MIEWLQNNWIETVGAGLALFYLILEVRQNWIMWIIGIISSIFYIYIFFEAQLYAETGLNVYYAAMSFYGLYCWKFVPTKEERRGVQQISQSQIIKSGIIGGCLFAGLSFCLARYTHSPVPFPDAFIATLGIIATWMTAKKIIESWYLWIVSNFFAIGLYIYQQLYPTSVLYVVYGILSIIGLREWRKSLIQKL
ncbi:MAG: nicotinamide riboside transporter PnuC [Dysgonamonadaceae bacterium]|jgi:nicotinamide mononucleotide transporter|nr:nicotinamide riboside transporter PnuC [Dysgonamonadaceae bacterium]